MDPISGLPLHPLIVHLPVVLLPLAAIGVAFLTFQPKARRRLSIPLLVVLAVGFAFTIVAKVTGERLSPFVDGEPKQHAELGGWLVWASGLFLAVAGGWLLWVRKDVRIAGKRDATASRKLLLGMISSMIGLGVLALTVTVGHLGARATWETVVHPVDTPTQATKDGVSMLEVSRHASDGDCWIAVDGEAYDVSNWLPRHPGGPSKVGNICGTDATDAFRGQHGSDERPNSTLDEYRIGPVVG
ncbi:cytochrome b5 domain-containing protein [uncultured Tessaracoccus sp.]|uniref:cytochrome b5 domain-containing protein n=1 Tax=uncultured Tessaracoccus sp. TaxID=905023 RepID=UPI0025D37991|nr:cytochrome b5 domain-containing protein [uncultured Tessaracoccus sp.]